MAGFMGAGAAAAGTVAPLGPDDRLPPLPGGVLVGEHLGQLDQADAFAVRFAGRLHAPVLLPRAWGLTGEVDR